MNIFSRIATPQTGHITNLIVKWEALASKCENYRVFCTDGGDQQQLNNRIRMCLALELSNI